MQVYNMLLWGLPVQNHLELSTTNTYDLLLKCTSHTWLRIRESLLFIKQFCKWLWAGKPQLVQPSGLQFLWVLVNVGEKACRWSSNNLLLDDSSGIASSHLLICLGPTIQWLTCGSQGLKGQGYLLFATKVILAGLESFWKIWQIIKYPSFWKIW